MNDTFQVIATGYRRRCAAVDAPCAICHGPIDYRLDAHPDAFTVGLIADDPNRTLAETNYRPTHTRCR